MENIIVYSPTIIGVLVPTIGDPDVELMQK